MQLPLQVPFCFKWVLKTFTLPFLHFWILFIVFLLSLSLFLSALQTEISHLQSILGAEWAQKCANNFNAKVQILVWDDVKKVRESMTHNVEKWSDTIHAKKSFTYRLYTLQSKFKGQLSTKVVEYFAKCFGYALVRNRNDAEGLKQNLRAIVPHAFGKQYCSVTWCGFLKDPSRYHHASLLHGGRRADESHWHVHTECRKTCSTCEQYNW